ncbi:indolepyruvate ferredoxin oxidoreductase family protein [Marinobacter lutaoensis]|jgi:indolepyruvate ferredoxin oxidoreductase|uniref:indolepyruvate ferredoxin oxidoreductase family protein n=1 Tax=Marinobacter lutaoensis TaxID=135739 RepID=UPI000C09DD86|nr:indolepyruvate ferredoxin oxidoreductase family protein [Marinobacter lutaoensis]MBE01685.1 indolepyruvate ferredoxin oxidoreductase [Marinobacter sp.]MBI44236.1 indolepyruvate ferredoxin oxidoreductase [Oceanospirillales bacterium]NVD36133.1 indolepyruvate ferredoxin oxidoreductase family protein [Marinobacter lutaoensis]|tara:strand:- start:1066 stop:4548 length:3483 start_codon:yes stop_codon:yes gene_type:complete
MTQLRNVSLNDVWEKDSGPVYMNGSQALARLPLLQAQLDRMNNLNTAGFISGYRGSPLGGFDKVLWKARDYLKKQHIHFLPGVNEDLGATAVWGSQQVNIFEGAKYDGVFALWYGKGPGVDRTGDVFKHANAAGTSRFGGVLAVAGDDHACKSSTLPHQSDFAFIDAGMPVLNPAGIQDMLDLGLYGWAMSRFSGCWVGFKALAENMDSSISANLDLSRIRIVTPRDFQMPEGGLNARWPDKPMEQEERLHRYKLEAAKAFCRANRLDRTVLSARQPRLGIVTTGKAYLDVIQALADLGLGEAEREAIGLTVYKVAMPWPLEPEGIYEFASGLEEILVVEEKRGLIEEQIKSQLYTWQDSRRPRVVGKHDDQGRELLPTIGELTPAMVARAIAARLDGRYCTDTLKQRLDFLTEKENSLAKPRERLERTPHFCSGCPHNTSTQVPEGSRALGGIGCHYMATWMDRGTDTFTQMGGEGVTWLGQAPFTRQKHVFQNLGDGTYFHSGTLAIRAAIASGANITYKILYNDAVAMTGGQPVDGTLTVQQITHQLYGEGVRRIAVVSDDPGKYPSRADFADGTTFHHRDDLDALQRELREVEGCSVIIYDQTCAAEKRRRRKRGTLADPDQRVIIHADVCEGCGDCGIQSNCLSILPKETEHGRKRTIDQSACNKDFSCVRGFCPSFVTVKGGRLRKPAGVRSDVDFPELPEPTRVTGNTPYGILLTGVGGTGVVTVSALLGMAAHLEGKGVSVLDQTGLAQKFGAVVSHVRISDRQDDIHAVRIPAGEADLMLAFDLMVAASDDALAKLDNRFSRAVVNTEPAMPAAFTRDPDLRFPGESMAQSVREACREDGSWFLDAGGLAKALMGDGMAVNLFTVGFAYQKGLLPLSAEAIERAIELNNVAVAKNKQAFLWGRRAAHDLERVRQLAFPAAKGEVVQVMETTEQRIQRHMAYLTEYQNAALAQRYEKLVRKAEQTIRQKLGQDPMLLRAIVDNYARVLAYKDEYEVARLFSNGSLRRQLAQEFEGDFELEFNLAPPLLSRAGNGERPKKLTFGPWMETVFGWLAKARVLRGTPFDPFGYTADRRLERRIIREYEADIGFLLKHLSRDHADAARGLASLPARIRGFGPVKEKAYQATRKERQQLRAEINPSAREHQQIANAAV